MAIKRKGSGKTKGAGSFVTISLGELNNILKGNAQVIVSRRFAETLSLEGEAFKATTDNIKSLGVQVSVQETQLETVEPVLPVSIKEHNLEDEVDW